MSHSVLQVAKKLSLGQRCGSASIEIARKIQRLASQYHIGYNKARIEMWIGKGPTFLDTLCIGIEHGVAPYIFDTDLGRDLGKFFVEQPGY